MNDSGFKMKNKILFENHFAKRVIEITFPDGFQINTKDDLQNLKKEWQSNLKSWHTPYTCIFDLRKFTVSADLQTDFSKLIQFFQRFHMRKIVGFKDAYSVVPPVDFEVFESYEEACQNSPLGRGAGLERNVQNLRDKIMIENDFHAHVMEISFIADTILTSVEDIQILKSKIKNILRQWHTPYSLLFNCINLKFTEEAKQEFLKLDRFLKGFFCKEIIGYSPIDAKENYPFITFRSRHIAAGKLESIGAHSGDSASCGPKIKK